MPSKMEMGDLSQKTTNYQCQVAQRCIRLRRCGNPHRLRLQRGGGHRMKVVVNTSRTVSTASFFGPSAEPRKRFRPRDDARQRAGELGPRPTSALVSAMRVVLLALVLAAVVLVVASLGQSGCR